MINKIQDREYLLCEGHTGAFWSYFTSNIPFSKLGGKYTGIYYGMFL